MKNYIDNVDFHNLEAQKYWAPPASYTPEKKKQEVYNAIFSREYVGARKVDGAFYKFVKDDEGNMELLGRSKGVGGDYLNKIDWVPQLLPFFEALPNGTCLLGEIYFPNNEGSNKVTTIMGCLKDKAIARQEAGEKLYYYIFDVLAYCGKVLYNHTIEERVEQVRELNSRFNCKYVNFAHYFDGEKLWNELQDILSKGGEGVVITKKGTCYQPGKRPAHQTIKVKKELQETIDVVVLGANPPTRLYEGKEIETWKYWENIKTGEKIKGELFKDYNDGAPIDPVTKSYWNNWAGSLVIGLYDPTKDILISIGSVSGLSEEVLHNWRNYKGKILEVGGMQLMRDDEGNFTGIRHPRALSWRVDKTIRECTMDQVK